MRVTYGLWERYADVHHQAVDVRWIKAHVTPEEAREEGPDEARSLGNELADRLANEGADLHGYTARQRAEANRKLALVKGIQSHLARA